MGATLLELEAVTVEQLLFAACVRATDGHMATLLWVNPDRSRTRDLLIRVPEVTPEHVDPVRRQILLLLAGAQTAPELRLVES
jgi:hypothetical protein